MGQKLKILGFIGSIALTVGMFTGIQDGYAVSVTPMGGVSLPAIQTGHTNYSSRSYTQVYGLMFNNRLFRNIELEWGILYGLRGMKDKGADTTLTLHTLQFPLTLRLFINRYVSFGLGAYFSHGMGNIFYAPNSDSSHVSKMDYRTASLSADDHGALASIQFRIPLARTIGLVLDARYLYGLRNINQAREGLPITLSDFQGLVGLRFGF